MLNDQKNIWREKNKNKTEKHQENKKKGKNDVTNKKN